jgi:hypothetical protein
MIDIEMPVGFMGKNFEDMTKDEVLKAFEWAYKGMERERLETKKYMDMYMEELFKPKREMNIFERIKNSCG